MAKERSIESRTKEHRKFREQCRRRIRPSITLFVLSVIMLLVAYALRPFSFWVFVGVLGFSVAQTAMEIYGYRYHTQKLKELSANNAKSDAATT